jgi:hypothetical protein
MALIQQLLVGCYQRSIAVDFVLTFAGVTGASVCTSCSSGRWTEGNSTRIECDACPINTYSDGSRNCTKCPGLTYTNDMGRATWYSYPSILFLICNP